jgi:hypothetical protein
MNGYQPATPRTAFGAIAFALTLVTFGLFVAGPAALAANGTRDASCAASGSLVGSEIAVEAVRTLSAVDVVALRKLQG